MALQSSLNPSSDALNISSAANSAEGAGQVGQAGQEEEAVGSDEAEEAEVEWEVEEAGHTKAPSSR